MKLDFQYFETESWMVKTLPCKILSFITFELTLAKLQNTNLLKISTFKQIRLFTLLNCRAKYRTR